MVHTAVHDQINRVLLNTDMGNYWYRTLHSHQIISWEDFRMDNIGRNYGLNKGGQAKNYHDDRRERNKIPKKDHIPMDWQISC